MRVVNHPLLGMCPYVETYFSSVYRFVHKVFRHRLQSAGAVGYLESLPVKQDWMVAQAHVLGGGFG